MKNLGNTLLICVIVAAVAIYIIGQEFGEGAAVAAILFASHGLAVMVGYGMAMGGVRSGMQALNDHDKIHSRLNAMDKRMDADLFRAILTSMKFGMKTGDIRARAYRAELAARQRQALPEQEEDSDPYVDMDGAQSFSQDQW